MLVRGAKAEPSTESGGYAPAGGFYCRKIFPPFPYFWFCQYVFVYWLKFCWGILTEEYVQV